MFRLLLLMISLFMAAERARALECGGPDDPCQVAGGAYHIAVPAGWQGGPAVLHLHGYGGSGAKVIRNKGFVETFTARGYAVLAPSGQPWREGKPTDWSVRDGGANPREDIGFLRAVLADAAARAGVDAELLLSGFSRGGSMVWEVACLAPDFASAYAAAAGGFWMPMTADCAGPVHFLPIHGFSDTVVPLEGRAIPNSEFGVAQADVWEGLQLWRRENGCPSNAAEHEMAEGKWRKRWRCKDGSLELILHKGGHGLPKGGSSMVLDWFENLKR